MSCIVLKASDQGKFGGRVIFGPEQSEPDSMLNFWSCRCIGRLRWFHARDVLKTKANQLCKKRAVTCSNIERAVQIG